MVSSKARRGRACSPFLPADPGIQRTTFATIDVVDCGATPPVRPLLEADADSFDPGVVNLVVVNAARFEDATTQYRWSFGDGTTAVTPTASVQHRFPAAPGSDEKQVFHVEVIVRRAGVPDVGTTRTFVVWDNYNLARRRGVLEPPVEVIDEVMRRTGTDLVGDFRITNREASQLRFNRRRIDRIPCDASLSIALGAPHAFSLIVPPSGSLTTNFQITDATLGSTMCGVTVSYWGTTAAGQSAQISVSMNRPGDLNGPDVTPFMSELLSHVVDQGLVADAYLVTEEQLAKLYRERKIRYDAANEVFYQSAEPPVGSRGFCDPEAPGVTPELGFTCQPTSGWFMETPLAGEEPQSYIANARKGDAVLVRACGGFITDMMGKLSPPQLYTHTGIMTKNRFELRQSTGETKWLEKKPSGSLGEPTDGFEEYYLRYLWPGTITSTVDQAFDIRKRVENPDGEPHGVKGFARSEARCSGDSTIVWPRVLKPAPEFEAAVRPTLEAAADGSKAIHSHYRFYGYSNATDTAAGDPNGPDPILDASGNPETWGRSETVCSSFVRLALKSTGRVLDADKTIPSLSPIDFGPPDGLYYYSPQERVEAGHALYASLYNKVQRELELLEESTDDYWWIGATAQVLPGAGLLGGLAVWGSAESGDIAQWATDAPDDVASQVTNCFASDFCSDDAKDSDAWHEPGHGFAVSPDDMMNYFDPPRLDASGANIGGLYGYHETMIYRGKRFRPRYAWLPSPGTRSVSGQVRNRLDDGSFSPVPNAFVEVQSSTGPKSTITDGAGNFTIDAVPAGNLLVYASANVSIPPGPNEFRDGESCYVLADPGNPVGLLNQVDCGDFTTLITPSVSSVRVDFLGPPEAFRHLAISGGADMRDCDCCGFETCSSSTEHRSFLVTCDVGPIVPTATFSVTAENLCVDEIGLSVSGTCTRNAADNSVRVQGTVTFYEEDPNSCGAGEPEESTSFDFVVPAGGGRGDDGRLTNHDLCPSPLGIPFECDDYADWHVGADNQVQP